MAITVTDVNEAPSITSATPQEVAENIGTGTVYQIVATDVDAATTLVYSIRGADSALFSVDASTGAVSFTVSPNFESPTDDGANNVYNIVVDVTDGVLTSSKRVAITVTDVNEAPVVTCVGTPGGLNCSWTPWAGSGTLDRYIVQVDLDLSDSTSWVNWGGIHFDSNTLIGGLDAPTNYTVRVGAIVDGVLQGYGETTTSTLALPAGPAGAQGPTPVIVFAPVTPGAANTSPSVETVQVGETVTVTLTIPVAEIGTQGATGEAGPQGATGATGPQGSTGAAGPQGSTGAAGPQGSTGAAGPQGATGAAGPQGAKGDKGATSIFGVISFVNSSATLKSSDRQALRQAGIEEGATIVVSGYTSKAGSTVSNKRLSKKRADAIAKEIKTILPKVNVRTVGFGEKQNKACAKLQNRCVIISVTQAAKS